MLNHFALRLSELPTGAEREIVLPSEIATRELGAELGQLVRPGDLIALVGPLGAGKTTFAQGLARGLGLKAEITSPTFALIHEHESSIQNGVALLHLDAYRLEDLHWAELCDAGIDDFLSRTDAVRLVEWPQMIAAFLPRPNWTVELHIENDERRARVQRGSPSTES